MSLEASKLPAAPGGPRNDSPSDTKKAEDSKAEDSKGGEITTLCEWCGEFCGQPRLCSGCKMLRSWWGPGDVLSVEDARAKFMKMDAFALADLWRRREDHRLPVKWFQAWLTNPANLMTVFALFLRQNSDLRILQGKREIAEFEDSYFPRGPQSDYKQLQTIQRNLCKPRTLIMAETAKNWLVRLGKLWPAKYHWQIVHAILPSVIDPWRIRLSEHEFNPGGISAMDCYYRDLGACAASPPTSFRHALSLWGCNNLDTGKSDHSFARQ